jgi:hypothetical protein
METIPRDIILEILDYAVLDLQEYDINTIYEWSNEYRMNPVIEEISKIISVPLGSLERGVEKSSIEHNDKYDEVAKDLTELQMNNIAIPQVHRLTYLEQFTNIKKLYCSNASSDIILPSSLGQTLVELSCSNCNVIGLNNMINLRILMCSDTDINDNDIAPLSSLRDLHCENTSITNVSNQTQLWRLMCDDTHISDISMLNSLQYLSCINTNITDVSMIFNGLRVRISDRRLINVNYYTKVEECR